MLFRDFLFFWFLEAIIKTRNLYFSTNVFFTLTHRDTIALIQKFIFKQIQNISIQLFWKKNKFVYMQKTLREVR